MASSALDLHCCVKTISFFSSTIFSMLSNNATSQGGGIGEKAWSHAWEAGVFVSTCTYFFMKRNIFCSCLEFDAWGSVAYISRRTHVKPHCFYFNGRGQKDGD